MTKRFYNLAVCILLAAGPVIVTGCNDVGAPNDVTDAQEQMRLHRAIPGPTELPPGLGDDLPPAPPTGAAQPPTAKP